MEYVYSDRMYESRIQLVENILKQNYIDIKIIKYLFKKYPKICKDLIINTIDIYAPHILFYEINDENKEISYFIMKNILKNYELQSPIIRLS